VRPTGDETSVRFRVGVWDVACMVGGLNTRVLIATPEPCDYTVFQKSVQVVCNPHRGVKL
jgi:hypothetical protein